MVGPSAAATEGVDLSDIGGAQSELEGVAVLRDPIGVNRFRDDWNVVCEMPGQHDQGRGRAAPIRDGGEGRMGERRESQWTVRLQDHSAMAVCGNQFRVVQRRIDPNLISVHR